MSESDGSMRVHLEHECFIATPKHEVARALSESLADPSTGERFDDFCRLVEGIYHFEFHEMANELKQDFRLFDTGGGERQNPPSEQDLQRAEERFLLNFRTLMEKGNFRPLTQADIDVAEAEDYLFNLPVRIDWDKLDSELLSRFFEKHPYSDDGQAPEFVNRILIYHRGVGVDRYTGFLTIQKIDHLVSNILVGIWHFCCGAWGRVQRLAGKGSAASEGDELTSRPIDLPESFAGESDPATPVSRENASQHVHQERYVERITLRSTGVNLASLLRRTQIQEPTFEELIILFRPAAAATAEEAAERNTAVHIKAFRQIPMADLEVVFPEKRISMKPLDLVKLIITGAVGLVVGATKIVLSAALNPVVALVALGTLLGYALKVFMGFKTSRDRYQHVVTNSLYHKNLDNDLGVIFYLMDSLEEQEFKEAVLGYYFLWQHGEMTEAELDQRCEVFLSQMFGEEVDFEVDDALEKLLRDDLVVQTGERYQARPLEEALERLDAKWDNFFRYSA